MYSFGVKTKLSTLSEMSPCYFCNCARSLEYSSLSTLAGLSYHICGKLEVAFKASPSSQQQHCTDEAQKAETVGALVTFRCF